MLKLLSNREVELSLVGIARISIGNLIETITPVKTEQTEYRQIYPYAESCRALKLKWVEFFELKVRVPTFCKCKDKNGCLWIERYRVSHFERVFFKDCATYVTT